MSWLKCFFNQDMAQLLSLNTSSYCIEIWSVDQHPASRCSLHVGLVELPGIVADGQRKPGSRPRLSSAEVKISSVERRMTTRAPSAWPLLTGGRSKQQPPSCDSGRPL